MTIFDDFRPEDAYDADDPPLVRLVIIARVLDSLTDDDDIDIPRLIDIARVLSNLAAELGGG